jgi:hypothetical protein
MTKPTLTNSGRVIMDVAVYQRGRTPIASAVLRNGLMKIIHVFEFQDGECILMTRDLTNPKCRTKNGELIKSGVSSFVSWEPRMDTLHNITKKAQSMGFQVLNSKRTSNLPLLQVPLVLQDQIAA